MLECSTSLPGLSSADFKALLSNNFLPSTPRLCWVTSSHPSCRGPALPILPPAVAQTIGGLVLRTEGVPLSFSDSAQEQ